MPIPGRLNSARNPVLAAGLAYFALAFGAGFLLGIVRVIVLVPRLGLRNAELLEMPVMFLVIVFSARFVVHRFSVPSAARPRLATGGVALALLVAAELLLVLVIQKQSLAGYLAGRDPVSGSVYLLMLAAFALMPFFLARLRPAGTAT